MFWDNCLYLSLFLFVALTVAGFLLHKSPKRPRLFSLLNVVLGATAISAYILVLPLQRDIGCGVLEGILITVQHMLQVFSLDGDFGALREVIQCSTPALQTLYYGFASFLYMLAPILTLGVVLSFFHDASAYLRLQRYRWRSFYVFSELNERSLVLARSCLEQEKRQGRKAALIFTDVFPANEESSYELQDQAERMGALCFKKDILSLRLPRCRREISFFVLGEDDSENIEHSLQLVTRYGQQENARLYSFASSTESALLLGSAVDANLRMTVRRINQAQSLVYNYLYENNLFSHAIDLPGGEKLLRVVIVGMGRYGTEFLKGITWAGQVPGYQLELHVFEQDPNAEECFTSQCPELMKLNNNDIDGEAHYNIVFHRAGPGQGIDMRTHVFDTQIAALGPVSLAIVALGSDQADIEAAVKLRTLFRRSRPERTPAIEAVVYQTSKARLVKNRPLVDYRGNDAQIHFIGDLEDTYSYDVIVGSELERLARERHLKWASKEQIQEETVRFYRFEYFYRSSVASVIRRQIRSLIGVPGIDKEPGERTDEERLAIQRMEHAGWNAYMRTEGFCLGKRDDLAKLHHDLVPFDQLPARDIPKDDD